MDRITDRPDMTSAVYRGRKASTQTNKNEHTVNISQFSCLLNHQKKQMFNEMLPIIKIIIVLMRTEDWNLKKKMFIDCRGS